MLATNNGAAHAGGAFDIKMCVCSLVLKELTMKVLNCMSSFISLPAIIQRILQVCV